jgi:hypothetical protein
MTDERFEPFSPDEQLDLELAMEKIRREHLIKELADIRRQIRDKIITRLMELNQMAQETRAKDAALVEAGVVSASILDFYDGFAQAIAETGAHVANMDDSDSGSLSLTSMREYMLKQAADATELHVHDGYRSLARFFES